MSSGVLAIDLGLRTGLAFFEDDGPLAWYHSHHFANNELRTDTAEAICLGY